MAQRNEEKERATIITVSELQLSTTVIKAEQLIPSLSREGESIAALGHIGYVWINLYTNNSVEITVSASMFSQKPCIKGHNHED